VLTADASLSPEIAIYFCGEINVFFGAQISPFRGSLLRRETIYIYYYIIIIIIIIILIHLGIQLNSEFISFRIPNSFNIYIFIFQKITIIFPKIATNPLKTLTKTRYFVIHNHV